MPPIDPNALLLCNLLVTLAVLGLLWVSQLRMDQTRAAVQLWAAGDLLHAMSYLLRLLHGSAAATSGADALAHGMLNGSAIVLHGLALQAVFGASLQASRVARVVLGALLAFVAAAALLPVLLHSGMLIGVCGLVGSVWSLAILRPQLKVYLGARWIAVTLAGIAALITIGLTMQLAGSMARVGINGPPRLPELVVQLATGLGLTMGFLLVLQERLRHHIELLSTTDPLTGALNRRGFVQQFEREVARAQRLAGPLSLALLDLDHFKRVNDSHGHALGDEVLAGFARHVRTTTRPADVLGRWGGEEFVLLMPATDLAQAVLTLERLRDGVAHVGLAPHLPVVTVSGGIAAVAVPLQGCSIEALLQCADRNLYAAKERRNCVVASPA